MLTHIRAASVALPVLLWILLGLVFHVDQDYPKNALKETKEKVFECMFKCGHICNHDLMSYAQVVQEHQVCLENHQHLAGPAHTNKIILNYNKTKNYT